MLTGQGRCGWNRNLIRSGWFGDHGQSPGESRWPYRGCSTRESTLPGYSVCYIWLFEPDKVLIDRPAGPSKTETGRQTQERTVREVWRRVRELEYTRPGA